MKRDRVRHLPAAHWWRRQRISRDDKAMGVVDLERAVRGHDVPPATFERESESQPREIRWRGLVAARANDDAPSHPAARPQRDMNPGNVIPAEIDVDISIQRIAGRLPTGLWGAGTTTAAGCDRSEE